MEGSAGHGRITRIAIAPIKGLAVHHVDSAELGPNGVAENRRLHLVDEHGRFVNGKTDRELTLVSSQLELAARTLTLRFPEGGEVTGTMAVGEPVLTDFYGRPTPGRVIVGPWARALSDRSGRALRVVMSDEIGAASDRGAAGGVSIISEASVLDLAREGGAASLDSRRFRMLFEIDGVEAYAEDAWIGRDVRIGPAVVRPEGNIGRCVVTTRDPDTAERDFDTLRVLAAYRGDMETTEPLPLGVVARVVTPGPVRVGDAVAPF